MIWTSRTLRGAAPAILLGLLSLVRDAHADAPSVAVIETRATGVPAVSASAVTREIYATVARLGYRAIPEAATARAMPKGSSPSTFEVYQVLRDTGADHAVEAMLGPDHGHYALLVVVANRGSNTPGFAARSADAASLEPAVSEATRSLFSPQPSEIPASSEAKASAPSEPGRSRLALNTEAAFGIAKYPFYNQLAGGRYDYGFTPDLALGAFVGYANLKGKDGRAQNVLSYLQFEYRAHLGNSWGGRIPFRFASGYLPKNGPFLRVSAGLSFPIGESAHLGLDLLAPTIWVVGNRTAASLDAAAEVSFDL